MRRHLEHKRVEASVADRALDTLIEDGYLDDARFARLFVQDKRELELWGADRIERALLGRGIDRELVESALAPRTQMANWAGRWRFSAGGCGLLRATGANATVRSASCCARVLTPSWRSRRCLRSPAKPASSASAAPA